MYEGERGEKGREGGGKGRRESGTKTKRTNEKLNPETVHSNSANHCLQCNVLCCVR